MPSSSTATMRGEVNGRWERGLAVGLRVGVAVVVGLGVGVVVEGVLMGGQIAVVMIGLG